MPLARASSVLHRPSTDKRPADAMPSVLCGASLRLTASASASPHSLPRTESAALCSADSADEHAVSTLKHAPCSPSTNDRRPAATDTLSPVTAYTEPATEGGCTAAQSGRSIPRNTPLPPPTSRARRCDAPCSDAYPSSSSSRCCGSVAAASAAEMPNASWSKRCAPTTKPPCRTHAACTALSAVTSTASPSVHRADARGLQPPARRLVGAPASPPTHRANQREPRRCLHADGRGGRRHDRLRVTHLLEQVR